MGLKSDTTEQPTSFLLMNYFTLKIITQKQWKKNGTTHIPFSPSYSSVSQKEKVLVKCACQVVKLKTVELVLCRVSTVLVRKKKKKIFRYKLQKITE